MSDIANIDQLTPAQVQPPLGWYFDPGILEVEQRLLFAQGPNYVGHELMVPNQGDYHVLRGDAQILVRNQNGVELLSNICRHRQAIMLEGRGNAQHIVCPIHRWTYKTDGELLGAPHFPQNPCLNLNKSPLQNWNGLLFSGKRDVAKDLARVGVMQDLDFSGYMLDRVQVDEYAFNWKTFIEGLSRGLPRRAVPSRPRQFRGLRRPQVGIRRTVQRARPSASATGCARPAAMCTANGRNRCCAITAANCPNTARSG